MFTVDFLLIIRFLAVGLSILTVSIFYFKPGGPSLSWESIKKLRMVIVFLGLALFGSVVYGQFYARELVGRAKLLAKKGDAQAAIATYTTAINSDTANASAYRGRATLNLSH